MPPPRAQKAGTAATATWSDSVQAFEAIFMTGKFCTAFQSYLIPPPPRVVCSRRLDGFADNLLNVVYRGLLSYWVTALRVVENGYTGRGRSM